ncbi:MAG: RimK family alpha-L-glutamate ligase [Candidatus Blackburnbacteria bacterium]|nr:RimK family alpha-L-glutamate ligase [Candidatus Blackburnbacteria bacterium]
MKILVVGVVKNHQVVRLKEEAQKRGHSLDACIPSDLAIEAGTDNFMPVIRGKAAESYDLIYLWAVGKRRWEWYTACFYFNKNYKTIIVDHKVIDPGYRYYLSPAIDYLRQTEHSLPYPKSAIVFSSRGLRELLSGYDFPLIAKAPDRSQGKGVYKVENYSKLKQVVDELKSERKACIIREFIPNDGDIRVFTVGYKAVGAMKRTPKEGDFRSNISQGGSGARYDLESNPRVREIAEKASKITRTEIAGVDIMVSKKDGKPYILEVNPGPQFTGFEKYTGINAAEEIIKYFESLRKGGVSSNWLVIS